MQKKHVFRVTRQLDHTCFNYSLAQNPLESSMNNRLLDPEWQPWWKQLLKIILGWNLAVIIKGVRLGPSSAWSTSVASFDAAAIGDLWGKDFTKAKKSLAQIPEVPLIDLIGNRRAFVRLDIQRHQDGMLPQEHAIALLALADLENPSVVLEIGTFCGHTTRLLAQTLPMATIHTVDLPLDYVVGSDSKDSLRKDDFHLITQRAVGKEFNDQPEAGRIRQHLVDTAQTDFAFAKGASFFFIDGSHTYDYVKSDSEKCFDLCQGKGVFVWHDCDLNHAGVASFLSEWKSNGREIVRIKGTSIAYYKAS